MRRLAITMGLLLSALGFLLVSGCQQGPSRYEVAGTVLYDGQPLDNGVIFFEPQDGQASGDGATITNGAYRIPKDKRLMPGRYKITIVGGTAAPAAARLSRSRRAPALPRARNESRRSTTPGPTSSKK
jgi:hypothetical protein